MHKKPTEFWKAWSAKFRKNISSDVKFKYCTNDVEVANRFAEKFSSVYYNSKTDGSAVDEFMLAL